jgi:hypothetical protein
MERRGRRRKQLLIVLKKTKGYWKLKAEMLDCAVDNSFWKGLWMCRKTDYGMNEYCVANCCQLITSSLHILIL